MKKFLLFSFVFCFFVNVVLAQNSAALANKNTAIKCLKIAEEALGNGDWENAFTQAQAGLAYDDSISDLIYIKAAAKKNLGEKNADVLPIITEAFEKDCWVDYTQSGARILMADILCDTGHYDESLSVLDVKPVIASADAELIRIKDYYRLGTVDALDMARVTVDYARRTYPSDVRFPEIFFSFEAMFKTESEIKGIDYVIPENVQTIADFYISKFPDYSGQNEEFEVYSLFLAKEDILERLVKSVSAKTQSNNPMLTIAQMKIGMISDSQAFEDFFANCQDKIYLSVLELFVSYVKDEEVQQKIVEKLTNYDGLILTDEDLDLQIECSVKYSLGRPQYINYDQNNDGNKDLYCSCDYGSPVYVDFSSLKTEVFYDAYPSVQKINFLNDNYTFNFLHKDYYFIPFELIVDNQIKKIGLDFYIPEMNSEISAPTPEDLVLHTSSVELPISERNDSKIVYTTLNGNLVYAKFYENETLYAYCDFSVGYPFVRYVDYDNDNHFETSETYARVPENCAQTDEELEATRKIFSKAMDGNRIYLKKVQIDRNSNTFYEFVEEFLSGGGSIISWDNDDNGLVDCQFIKYPASETQPAIEESVFYDSNGLEIVALYSVDGVPLKMEMGSKDIPVLAGETPGFYWVGISFSKDVEEKILEYTKEGLTQGVLDLVEYKGERYSVIRIGSDVFCNQIPYTIE